jgi:hypothetical protein
MTVKMIPVTKSQIFGKHRRKKTPELEIPAPAQGGLI